MFDWIRDLVAAINAIDFKKDMLADPLDEQLDQVELQPRPEQAASNPAPKAKAAAA